MTIAVDEGKWHIEYHVLPSQAVGIGAFYDQNVALDRPGRVMWATGVYFSVSDLDVGGILITDVPGNSPNYGRVYGTVRARCLNTAVGVNTIIIAITIAIID